MIVRLHLFAEKGLSFRCNEICPMFVIDMAPSDDYGFSQYNLCLYTFIGIFYSISGDQKGMFHAVLVL